MTEHDPDAYWDQLLASLTQLVAVLRAQKEQHWSGVLSDLVPLVTARDFLAASKVLSLYGGMGSLTGLWLCEINGHVGLKSADQESKASAAVASHRGAMAEAARALYNLSLNLQDEAGQWYCPACGAPGDQNGSYTANGGIIGRSICECCLWQPGFDDDQGASATAQTTVRMSLLRYRERWIAEGQPWRGERRHRPPDWSAKAQLSALEASWPHLIV